MKKLIMTKGLPASGKSTWAKDYQGKNPNTVRVNKDDLRAMLHNSVWSHGREDFVLKVRNFIVTESLKAGHDVIVDDTNLSPKHEVTLRNFALQAKAEFEIKDFTDITVDECIKRDLKRSTSVGEKVIKDMYKEFLAPKPEVIENDPNLPDCIICDLDGTLAHMVNRGPFDWAKVGGDEPDFEVWEILLRYRNVMPVSHQMEVILLSGRDSICKDKTMEWLGLFDIPYDKLYMRKKGDMRKDSIIKRELYEKHIKGKYNVQFVLDDRNQVVEMWRSLGLKCLQVAEGDF